MNAVHLAPSQKWNCMSRVGQAYVPRTWGKCARVNFTLRYRMDGVTIIAADHYGSDTALTVHALYFIPPSRYLLFDFARKSRRTARWHPMQRHVRNTQHILLPLLIETELWCWTVWTSRRKIGAMLNCYWKTLEYWILSKSHIFKRVVLLTNLSWWKRRRALHDRFYYSKSLVPDNVASLYSKHLKTRNLIICR